MRCDICGNETNNILYKAEETMFGFGEKFDYFKCSACGCLQILEIPDNMEAYYPKEYYSFVSKPVNYEVNPLSKWIKKTRDNYAIFGKGLLGRLLFQFIPNNTLTCLSKINLTKQSSILDVGCGSGIFLHTLRELGFQNLKGIDPYLAKDIIYNNGLVIEKKSIHEQNGEWDVIMLHHSFEHIPDQLETFQAISRLLKSNGTCLIRIPIVSSFAWEHYKEKWIQLDAPRHFFLHSLNSIDLLAKKTGMQVTQVEYDSDELQFVGSEQFMKGIPLRGDKSYVTNPSESMFSKSDIAEFKKKARKLNMNKQGDQAAFYLKRTK